jgi:hypothetical protein
MLGAFTTAKLFLGRIPKQVWIVLGMGLLILAGLWWHGRAVNNFGEKKFAEGVTYEQKRIEKKVAGIVAKSEEVSRNAQELARRDFSRIRGNARAVLLRGPGKAACSPVVPIGSGPVRPDPAGSNSVVAVPGGQGQQLIGMPFAGTVALAENHDLCWARVRAWEKWYSDQAEIWKKSN